MLRRDYTYTLHFAITPLAILRQSFVIVYAFVPSVIILRLSICCNLSVIAWQASYDIGNNGKSLYLMHVEIKWITKLIENIFYHCMLRLLYRIRCICRCFLHSFYRHWVLRNIWFNKCVIVHHKWMSRWIRRLCQTHEGMRNHVEPLYVVCCTLSKHNTYLTHRCKIFRKLNPSIINIFYA